MSVIETSFVGLVTFDANTKHAEITDYLHERGYKKKSLSGHDISFNTYIGIVKCEAELNGNGCFTAGNLKKISDRLADNLRESIKEFFDRNNIDGSVYVLFSWAMSADDSTSL